MPNKRTKKMYRSALMAMTHDAQTLHRIDAISKKTMREFDIAKHWKRFVRDSISSWKKYFLPQCSVCLDQEKCSGLFSSSICQSASISPKLA